MGYIFINKKLAISCLILAVLVKLSLLSLGSQPFDFVSYVYQPRGYFDYNFNPLFYWNKGSLLLSLFYANYSAYSVLIAALNIVRDNPLLIHLIYKIPLLLSDLITAVLIFKIVLKVTRNKLSAYIAGFSWILNPLITWTTELHGQYAIIVSLCIVGSIYAILNKKYKISLFLLAISVSIYYYTILFLPLYLAFEYKINQTREVTKFIIKRCITFTVYIASLFSLFLLDPSYIISLIQNLIYHSAPDAPSGVSSIQIPDISLFNIPYIILFHTYPTNISAPFYFHIVSLTTFIGILFIGLTILLRVRKIIKSESYNIQSFIVDLILITGIFIVLVGKMQSHYLLWIIPILILIAALRDNIKIYTLIFLISLMTLVLILGSNNLGTYFLDTIQWGTTNYSQNYSTILSKLAGFTVMLILIAAIVYSYSKNRVKGSISEVRFALSINVILLLVLFIVSIIGYASIIRNGLKSTLASDSIALNYSYSAKYSLSQARNLTNTDIVRSNLSNINDKSLSTSGYLNNGSPWYLYVFGKSSLNLEKKSDNGDYLRLISTDSKPSGAIDMGNDISRFIKISPNSLYNFSAYIRSTNLDNNVRAKFSVRYANISGKIISGSDQTLSRSRNLNFTFESKDVLTPPEAQYAELTVSFDGEVKKPGSIIDIKDINGYLVNRPTTIVLDDIVRKNNDTRSLNSLIFNTDTNKKFEWIITVPTQPKYAYGMKVKMNNCTTNKYTASDDYINFHLPSNCFNASSNNHVEITSVNGSYSINPIISLKHILQTEPFPEEKIGIIIFLSAVYLIVITFLIGTIVKLMRINK